MPDMVTARNRVQKRTRTKTQPKEAYPGPGELDIIEERSMHMPEGMGEQVVSSAPLTRMPSLSRSSLLPSILVALVLTTGYVHAAAECMSGNNLKCFECNSHQDPYCSDPFNWTTLPKVKTCDGCCVKLVQGIGTPDLKIRRGCTEDIDINLFMVDHVCMSEGGGKGRMCFCEENECNAAVTTTSASAPLALVVPVALALATAARA